MAAWQAAGEALDALVEEFPTERAAIVQYFAACGWTVALLDRPQDSLGQPRRPWGEHLAAFEAACDDLWKTTSEADRRALGQVFSPTAVIDDLLDDLGYDGIASGLLLDPACGTGAFLARAVRRILAPAARSVPSTAALVAAVPQAAARAGRAGRDCEALLPRSLAQRALSKVVGIELEPRTAGLARLRIALLVADFLASTGRLDGLAELRPPQVICADALAMDRPGEAFRWIVGNPPYLEAKRARAEDKRRWRERFGDRLEGAFDLYVCFLELALEWLAPGGEVGMILPNKFLVSRYARSLRRRMLAHCPPVTLRDLSERELFARVGVYPVTLHARSASPADVTKALATCESIGPAGGRIAQPLSALGGTGSACTWFIPEDPEIGALLCRLLDGEMPRLGQLVELRTTVSFHAVGLRERYVHDDAQTQWLASEHAECFPYLGGQSWARQKEIGPFNVRWAGYSIRYAAEELAACGNPLPPLSRFLAPKIVFCQHARRLAAFWDGQGRFVTKDVYPVALAPPGAAGDPRVRTAAFAAMFNSRLLSVLYAVLFRGICIGGGYYHYLPAFLEQLPCPEPHSRDMAALAALTTDLQAPASWGLARADRLDDRVEDLYGLTIRERAAVARAFLRYASNDDPFTAAQSDRARQDGVTGAVSDRAPG